MTNENEVIKTLMNHRSYHQYSDQPIDEKDLDTVIQAAQAAPSWIHGQQVSIIMIKDPGRKQKLAELAGNQAHIAQAPVFLVFCADFYRAKLASELEDKPFKSIHDTDMLLVGATDVGLAMSNAIAAAESLGLGILPIGGIRKAPLEVVEFLHLPQYVFPVAGLCVGYPGEDIGKKPRLSKKTVCFSEQYDTAQAAQIQSYNEKHREYLRLHGKPESDWTARVAAFYEQRHYNGGYPDVASMLKQQGFTCDDMKDK